MYMKNTYVVCIGAAVVADIMTYTVQKFLNLAMFNNMITIR